MPARTIRYLVGVDVDTEIGDFSVMLADAPVLLPSEEPVKLQEGIYEDVEIMEPPDGDIAPQ